MDDSENSGGESTETEAAETEAGVAEAGEPQKHPSKSRVVMVVAGVVAAALVIGGVGFVVSTRNEPEVANAGTGTDILVFLGQMVVGAAVGDGFNSVLGALFPEATADPTAAKVDEVKAQIDGLTVQISALQAATQSLSDQVDKDFWSENASRLQDDLAALKNMQTTWIAPLAAEGAIYSKARLAGDTAAMATAETNLNKAKDNFINGYNNSLVTNEGIADRLHNDIVPSAGATSILSARGKVLMAKGYLTAEDSQELRDLYDMIAQQQALAVYINAEFQALQENGDGVHQGLANDVVTRWKTNQAAEFAALPPVIPPGVIIATPNKVTANATMWMGSGRMLTKTPGLAPFDLASGSNVLSQVEISQLEALRTEVNSEYYDADAISSYGREVTGWDYPSTQAQFDQLTAAVASSPGNTVGEKLAAAGAGRTTNFNFVQPGVPFKERVWVNPTQGLFTTAYTCVEENWLADKKATVNVSVPYIVNMTAPTAVISGLPLYVSNPYMTYLPSEENLGERAQQCSTNIGIQWANSESRPDGGLSSVLWARTVGAGVDEDYMAQSGNYSYNLPASTYPPNVAAAKFANDQTDYPSDGPDGYTCQTPPSQKFLDDNC